MSKLRLLMIIPAVVWLIVSIFAPSIFAPLAPLYCPAGQKLVSDKHYYSYGNSSGFNINFYCTDGDKQTDVGGQVTLTIAVIFIVLLLGGMALASFSRRTATVQQMSFSTHSTSVPPISPSGTFTSPPKTYISTDPNSNPAVADIMSGLQRGVIRFGGQEISIADLKSGAYQQQVMSGGQHTLADTLRQLEDAHKQGLINSDEYGHLRQEALNKLV